MNHNPFIHDHNPFCPFTVEGTLFRHGQEIKRLEATKQDKLTAGPGISIDEDNVISATGGGGGGDSTVLDLRNEIAATDNLQPLIDELATDSIDTILLPATYDPEISGEIIELDIPDHVRTITAGGTYGDYYIPRYFIKGTHSTLTLNNGKFKVNNGNRNGFAFYANEADLKDINGYPQIYFRGCIVDNIVPTGGYAVYTTFNGEKGMICWNPVTLISCFVEKVTAPPGAYVATAQITAINTEFRGTQTIPNVNVFNAIGCKFGNVTITNNRVANISDSLLGNTTFEIAGYAKMYNSDKPLYNISGCTAEHITFNNSRFTADQQPLIIANSVIADEPDTNAEIMYNMVRVGNDWR